MDFGTWVLMPKICFSCKICWGMMVGMPPDYIIKLQNYNLYFKFENIIIKVWWGGIIRLFIRQLFLFFMARGVPSSWVRRLIALFLCLHIFSLILSWIFRYFSTRIIFGYWYILLHDFILKINKKVHYFLAWLFCSS